jgi:iron(III) transport system ATP-binding protein
MTIKSKAASVTFQSVIKAYGDVVAVNGVSFTIEPGTLVTLLGPSGCGKTTTLRMIAGLEMATKGNIFIGEEDVTKLPATDRDVSMVFQSYALFPHMTVLENVSYGLLVSGQKKAEAHAAAEDGLGLVGLSGYGKRLPSELSGGQQQRVAVARALVLEPSVLLFDEPLSNLDAKLRRRVREEIRELQQELGLTTVYVTHDQEEAAQTGSPHQLYDEPADLFVADFIGDANLVKGELVALEDSVAVVNIGGTQRRLPHRDLAPGEVDVAVRPEAITLSQDPTNDGIEGQVKKATYLGSHMEYTVDCVLGELFVIDHQVDHPVPPDSTVRVVLAGRGVTLVRSEEAADA